VDQLRYLVSNSAGKLCTFTDHLGLTWQVIILSADMTITQPGRFNYTADLKILVAS
jgi:hypothetical protein